MTPAPSFRDPAGSLVIGEETGVRTVRPEFARDTLDFLNSPVALEWTQRGRFISTEVIENASGGSPLRLAHPRIFFPSYPWEWTPAQLAAAASLTLDLCENLADSGWTLKDATPLNVLFDGSRPVFVDLLSVVRRDPESPIWLAYGQFVRTFLLPLAAYRYLGWPLSATLARRDGYEPGDLYKALGPLKRLRAPLRSLVTLPVWLEGSSKTRSPDRLRRSPPVALAVLKHTLASLRRTLLKLVPQASVSRWSSYPQTAAHYSEQDRARKTEFVRECISSTKPRNVLDIGANTGLFSRIAAENGARVIAWDEDVGATERAWLEASRGTADILPLIANFARPTPAVGWSNSENLSLLDRARGRFDMVMMLAVIHHLLVSDQIPMELVAKQARELSTAWLIVEWVPPTDPKFQELIRGRDALYSHLCEETFLTAFGRYFEPERRVALGNGRVLHLLRAR
jgi:SAM-dependent methyltransferase